MKDEEREPIWPAPTTAILIVLGRVTAEQD